jgi:amino acid transporter
VFFGVMGFDFISTLSDESINPVKDVPAAMRDSVLITTAFYSLIAISMCGMGLGKEQDGFNPHTAIGD